MPNHAGKIVFFLFAILICLLGHAIRANADTTLYARNSITSLLEHPSPLIHEPRSDEVDVIAAVCAEAEVVYGVPCLLLVSMMHHESRFDYRAVGKKGELGLLQIHGVAARGCDLEDIRGQVFCGASWLKRGYDQCGAWWGALYWYAAGACSPADNQSRLSRRITMREHLWQRLKKQSGE